MKQRHEWVDGFNGEKYAVASKSDIEIDIEIPPKFVYLRASHYGPIGREILRLSAEVDRLKALTSEEDRARSEHYARWADEAHIVFCHILSHFNVGELKDTNLFQIIYEIRDLMWKCPGDIGTNLPEPPKEAE